MALAFAEAVGNFGSLDGGQELEFGLESCVSRRGKVESTSNFFEDFGLVHSVAPSGVGIITGRMAIKKGLGLIFNNLSIEPYAFSVAKTLQRVVLALNTFADRSRVRFLLGLLIVLGVFSPLAAAQTTGQSKNAPLARPTRSPEMILEISNAMNVADSIRLTMLDANYPPALLNKQIEKLGEELGSIPRGISLYSDEIGTQGGKQSFLRATFAVNNLTDRSRGTVNLQAVARAFDLGEGGISLKYFHVVCVGLKPASDAVGEYVQKGRVEVRTFNGDAESTQYEIALFKDSKDAIVIPMTIEKKVSAPTPEKVPGTGQNYGWILAILAVIGLGSLVYFLTLRVLAAK